MILAIRLGWFMQSNALQSSTRRAPNWFPLLIASLKSSVIAQFQFWPLISFLKPCWYRVYRGGSRDSEKVGGVLYVDHHCWPTKKILGFKWSNKAYVTLEIISFWRNIDFNIFKISPFLYIMKACRWILINFSKFTNAFIKKKKKKLIQQSIRKEKLRKVGICYFIKPFKMTVNQFFFNRSFCSQMLFFPQACLQRNFRFLISGWTEKCRKGILGTGKS